MWESTSHILGYYHGIASYAANGALSSLDGIPGYTKIVYGLDGEGRPNTATQGTTNLVTGVTYTPASQPQTVSLGAGDSDNYGYDGNTGRMTNYTFTVGSTPKSQTGTLTWNPNGTLQQLVIGDGFNTGSTGGSQTCKFGDPLASPPVPGYDDLGRLVRADCGSAWLQTFSYDPYGNISKSGSSSWMPGYDPATNHASSPIAYDNNGNLIYDTLHTYAWYVDHMLASTDSTTCGIFGSTDGTCILYDAFGREVERGVNGSYKEVMYTPVGKTAIMSGQTTTVSAYFPLPGGATYYQTGSANGTGYFWHKDWLGSVRLSSSVLNRTYYFDRAFAPYGEMYKNFGNTGGLNFTGDTQDSFAGLLYDTPNRELHRGQGRWISPDPAGLATVDPANPQTWNRYAYVLNNPLGYTDPTGLDCDGIDCGGDNPCSFGLCSAPDPCGWTGDCGGSQRGNPKDNIAPHIFSGQDCLSCFPLGPSPLQILQAILSGNLAGALQDLGAIPSDAINCEFGTCQFNPIMDAGSWNNQGKNLNCKAAAANARNVAIDSHNPSLSDIFKVPNFIEAGIAGGLGTIKPLLNGAGLGAVATGFGDAAAIGLGAAAIYNYVDWGIHNNAPFEAQQNAIYNNAVQQCDQQFPVPTGGSSGG